jgi:hypothetical protein
MRYGEIPEFSVDIPDGKEGIELVRAVVNNRWVWVELTDPCLDGTTITRNKEGSLVTDQHIRRGGS